MKNQRSSIVARLRDSRGQSWVETVVMLPVIVALLLGLFYLHDLVTTRIRAIEAARFVSWESVWYGREDKPNRAMKTPAELKQRLKQVGLGFGLTNVDVFKRTLSDYKSNVSPGVEPSFFLPCALSNLLPGAGGCGKEGTDQSPGALEGLANGLSGVLSGLLNLAGDAAFPFQDLMAQNTNWDDEAAGSVYTTRVIYTFGYTGFFKKLGTSTIVQRASVLSHPYALRRTDDEKEYTELLGDPCANIAGTSGHVVKLWLFPSKIIPISGGGTSVGETVGKITDKVGSVGKCVVAGLGNLAGGLDKIIGSNLGFTMPDGTLKEYPELSMPANTGAETGNGSGGGLGGCQTGGGGAMGTGGIGGCP
jgi:hypothetical protein